MKGSFGLDIAQAEAICKPHVVHLDRSSPTASYQQTTIATLTDYHGYLDTGPPGRPMTIGMWMRRLRAM